MKNEERILELLAETLQRIDRHSEQFDRMIEQMNAQREQMGLQREQMGLQREQMHILIATIQQHDERLEQHAEALGTLRDRTEDMHQSSLEQVKAYQAITELVMYHNRALAAKGII